MKLPLPHSPLPEIGLDIAQLRLLERKPRRLDVAEAVRDVEWILEGASEPMIGPAYLKLKEEIDRRDVENHLNNY